MAPVVLQLTAAANNTLLTCLCVLQRPQQRTVAMAPSLTKPPSGFFFCFVFFCGLCFFYFSLTDCNVKTHFSVLSSRLVLRWRNKAAPAGGGSCGVVVVVGGSSLAQRGSRGLLGILPVPVKHLLK